MADVFRRPQDLLVGDVVADEGRARRVTRVTRDALAAHILERDITLVTFEDSPEVYSTRLQQMVQRASRYGADYRFLLLESSYSARTEQTSD